MTTSIINECKRRRVEDHCFRDVNIQLSDLPDSILVSIADFLSKTSVVLFQLHPPFQNWMVSTQVVVNRQLQARQSLHRVRQETLYVRAVQMKELI